MKTRTKSLRDHRATGLDSSNPRHASLGRAYSRYAVGAYPEIFTRENAIAVENYTRLYGLTNSTGPRK